MSESKCPWCESEREPVKTSEHLDKAIFRWRYKSPPAYNPHVVARNSLMCADCYQVGSHEDFGLPEPVED